jgi:long-chain acyl-CoA synthetase
VPAAKSVSESPSSAAAPGLRERLAALIERAARDAEAVSFDGVWWSWGQVADTARRVTRALDAAGLGAGARIGVALQNRPQHVAALLAVVASGRCVTTLNPLQPPDRLAADIGKVAVPVVLGSAGVLDKPEVRTAVGATGGHVLLLGDDGSVTGSVPAGDRPASAYNPGIAVEMLTSGTTGPPKRIQLSDGQFDGSLATARVVAEDVDGRPQLRPTVGIITAPLVHIGGLWHALSIAYAGRRMVLLDRFRVDDWVAAVRTHRPAVTSLVPAAVRAVLEADVPAEALGSLKAITSGTAPCPPELVDAFYQRYGIPVLATYGATEFAGGVAAWALKDHARWWGSKRGSVGRPFRGVEVRTVDEEGRPLPVGETGRLQLRARQIGGGEWTLTSDLGRLDDDGFLWVTGRADDAIIRGGFKVQPDTVKNALERHPAVREAAVAGLPDRRVGAVPVAVVETLPGVAAPTAEEVLAFSREHLLPYEVPARLLVVPELPRTPSLKVSRPDVLAMFPSEES